MGEFIQGGKEQLQKSAYRANERVFVQGRRRIDEGETTIGRFVLEEMGKGLLPFSDLDVIWLNGAINGTNPDRTELETSERTRDDIFNLTGTARETYASAFLFKYGLYAVSAYVLAQFFS